ncbi:bi-domain-containing oxidoreductase [Mesorhizobium sp. M1163]|uniref:bi-domain-containing oxidoreductase n=1 Tax=Mesorhizobium sp. M1163 TaxID=2957065 RepID=UPI00333DF2CB
MKQILQSLKTGSTEVADVPCPAAGRGQVLIRSSYTLISAGTERVAVDFGKAGLIGKARQQPDRVRQVLDKMRTDGLVPTLDAVFGKLDQPLPLGYCNVGTVVDTGVGVGAFALGDRVVSNGRHAEAVAVPVNLCSKVPDNVSDEEAAFTVLGAIALQGIRLIKPTLGEAVVVTGLGLIGLMAVQLLRANGCRVLGLDFDAEKLSLAEHFGAETVNLSAGIDPVAAALAFSRGRGVDAVLITASTKSSEPIHQGALMSRKRGRIVLVGVTGLELSRANFYEKELSFQVSCSYGPGRYDPTYEEKGQDYPVGFVRWTEQRNFEAVLDMLADGRIDVKPLISHRFELNQAEEAYRLVGGAGPSLGILLTYPGSHKSPSAVFMKRSVTLSPPAELSGRIALGFIGSGNYATGVLIPAFKAADSRLVSVASNSGVSGLHAGRKFGFESTTTDISGLLENPSINAVVIATRHDSHAGLVCRALDANKHVFVEKPLALTLDEMADIELARNRSLERGFSPIIMVGFNRRFAPHVVKMKSLLAGVALPKAFVMTVNAGEIPPGHWTLDREIGGGRVLGEACHFVDLLRYLSASPIVGQSANYSKADDVVSLQLAFEDHSIGTIHYLANGSKSLPKERLEVFAGGKVLQLDNFRNLNGYGWQKFSRMRLWRQDKGQKGCAAAFVEAVKKGKESPIDWNQLLEVSRITIELADRKASL